MQSPKEYKRWVNWMRKNYAKKNGVIPAFFFDHPKMEVKLSNSKKNYSRKSGADSE